MPVQAIETLRMDPVQLAHTLGEIALGRFGHNMIMVGHETVGITQPAHALTDRRQHVEERLAVAVIEENISAAIATRGDMVERTWKFEPKGTGHGA